MDKNIIGFSFIIKLVKDGKDFQIDRIVVGELTGMLRKPRQGSECTHWRASGPTRWLSRIGSRFTANREVAQ